MLTNVHSDNVPRLPMPENSGAQPEPLHSRQVCHCQGRAMKEFTTSSVRSRDRMSKH